MTLESDWLSRFMALVTVTGKLEIRCTFGAPWAVTYERSPAREIPYHVVLRGRAILETRVGADQQLDRFEILLAQRAAGERAFGVEHGRERVRREMADGGEQVGDGAAGDLADLCVHVGGCAGGGFDGGDGDAAHDWLLDRKVDARSFGVTPL
ncbi:hypothetical protein B7G54_15720 [Burkholderia puraquae]|uniref:AraC-type transcription regulator ligand-binding domain-containing protein n=3 Tax=Burkholderia puraquae TaxID=1904757 RepID=A0A1X1PGC4_9BURK|nr:hypothetical protein B7G54_15720 [Burkholderia puraquae]